MLEAAIRWEGGGGGGGGGSTPREFFFFFFILKKKIYRAVQKLFANLLKWTELNLQNHQQERLDTY